MFETIGIIFLILAGIFLILAGLGVIKINIKFKD